MAKAAYHKPVPDYPRCPSCHKTSCVNYIKQMQRGMRAYTCARCTVTFFFWGPKINNPRPLRDGKGKLFRFTDEIGAFEE